MEAHYTVAKVAEHSSSLIYAGTTASLVFWGLHMNEVCAIISTCVAVIGLGLQIYTVIQRHRRRHWY